MHRYHWIRDPEDKGRILINGGKLSIYLPTVRGVPTLIYEHNACITEIQREIDAMRATIDELRVRLAAAEQHATRIGGGA